MFGLLHNLYTYVRKKSEKKLTLVLLGIDNAGKTSVLNLIRGQGEVQTAPTFGFNKETLQLDGYKVDVYDLGGGKNIRRIWKSYFAEVHGIVFVTDSSDHARLEEAREALHNSLKENLASDKPLLILANKQDLSGAATPAEVATALKLTDLKNHKFNIVASIAKPSSEKQQGAGVHEGFKWVVQCIDKVYKRLNVRVEQDTELQRQEDERKKKERAEAARKAREERAKSALEVTTTENVLHNGAATSAVGDHVPLPNSIETPKGINVHCVSDKSLEYNEKSSSVGGGHSSASPLLASVEVGDTAVERKPSFVDAHPVATRHTGNKVAPMTPFG